jgi:Domain of unknown function (DUF6468)
VSSTVALIADLLVAILLVATIFTCYVLSRRIERLKADEATMRQTIGDLIAATDTAERAISGLKLTLGDCDRTLAERLRTAERYAADLSSQIEAGQGVLDRIAQIVDASARIDAPVVEETVIRAKASKRLINTSEMAAAITERAVRRLESQAA